MKRLTCVSNTGEVLFTQLLADRIEPTPAICVILLEKVDTDGHAEKEDQEA